ncbi:hypothetical protein [Streptomyces sp. MMBL 11-3]|uniref:hypothetical protein n=1 Tax=Streptomyces sp. MMBL 11-3 TaxID=3382639 RepID=UPI0039B5360D
MGVEENSDRISFKRRVRKGIRDYVAMHIGEATSDPHHTESRASRGVEQASAGRLPYLDADLTLVQAIRDDTRRAPGLLPGPSAPYRKNIAPAHRNIVPNLMLERETTSAQERPRRDFGDP